MPQVPKKEILSELRRVVSTHPTARVAARKLGVTPSVLSLTLNNHYPVIPARLLQKLGYQTETVYVLKKKKNVPAQDLPPETLDTTLPNPHPIPITMDDMHPAPSPPEIFINVLEKD